MTLGRTAPSTPKDPDSLSAEPGAGIDAGFMRWEALLDEEEESIGSEVPW